MNNRVKSIILLAGFVTIAPRVFAAGEIDSHRVVGDGLFGMPVPPSAVPSQPPDASGVYRDTYGALRDSGMSADTVNGARAQATNNNQPQSTAGLGSPTNTFVGTELSPNNASYTGGYGQYGPTNNLDLLRAGVTSDLRPATGVSGAGPVGTVSNYSEVLLPSEPIPAQPIYETALPPSNPDDFIQSQAGKSSSWVNSLNEAPRLSNVQPLFSLPSKPGNNSRSAAVPIEHVIKHSPRVADIGRVNGFIQYADNSVTLFGSNGSVTEAPDHNLVLTLPNQAVKLKQTASTKRKVAALEKSVLY